MEVVSCKGNTRIMHILSAILIIYCLICISSNDFDNETEIKNVYEFRSTGTSLKVNSNASAINSSEKRRYEQQERLFSFRKLKTVREQQLSNYRENNYQRLDNSLNSHFPFIIDNEYRSIRSNKLAPRRMNNSYEKSFAHCRINYRKNRRKLLGYSDKNSKDRRHHRKLREAHKKHPIRKQADSQEKEHASNEDDPADENHDAESWDDWGNWSSCTVTCGSGRRIRWRHCSSKNCTKGLKKAQIKACRLKECDKNLLNWLGIKS